MSMLPNMFENGSEAATHREVKLTTDKSDVMSWPAEKQDYVDSMYGLSTPLRKVGDMHTAAVQADLRMADFCA